MAPTSIRTGSGIINIRGVEGLTSQDILYEVGRGARFVMYQYTVSALVITFKRPTDVYFIKPGANAVVPGLGYSALSFVAGWWGIPWGIIFIIGALVRNFSGGLNVTTDLARFYEHAHAGTAARTPPPMPPNART